MMFVFAKHAKSEKARTDERKGPRKFLFPLLFFLLFLPVMGVVE